MKDKMLTIRITNKEKKELEALAKKEAHNSVAGFIMWAIRRYKVGKLRR